MKMYQYVVALVFALLFAAMGCEDTELDESGDDQLEYEETQQALFGTKHWETGYPAVAGLNWNNAAPVCTSASHYLPGNCSGTLIGSRTVLSAAHCGGDTYVNMCNGATPVQTSVNQILFEPTFQAYNGWQNGWVWPWDMMILKTNTVSSIMPKPFNVDTTQIYPGKRLDFVSRGLSEEGHTQLKQHGINQIAGVAGQYYTTYHHSSVPGFASEGSGDSGGPGFVTDSLGIEVVSGEWRGGGFQVRTDYYRDWIMEASNFNALPGAPFNSQLAKRIRKAGTNQCLYFMHQWSGLNIGTCGTGPEFKWDIILSKNHGSTFVFRNYATQKCFFTRNYGVDLYQNGCLHSANNMRFSIYKKANGRYMFISRDEDLCLDSTPDAPWSELQGRTCSLTDPKFEWEIII